MSEFNISLEDIKVYLNFNNWKSKIFIPLNTIAYKPPKNISENDLLYIPIEFDSRLENEEVENVIYNLCKITHKNNEDIVNDIIYISQKPIDIMKFRIISKLTDDGTLPLSLAATTVTGLTEALLNSIKYEFAFDKSLSKTKVSTNQYLNHFIFSQTNRGSFVFNIETKNMHLPQMSNNDLTLNPFNEVYAPPERKIFERIQFTLQQLEVASLYKNRDVGIKYMLKPDIASKINYTILKQFYNIFEVHNRIAKDINVHSGIKILSTLHHSPIFKGKSQWFTPNDNVCIDNKSFKLLQELNSELDLSEIDKAQHVILEGKVTCVKRLKPSGPHIALLDIDILNYTKIKKIKTFITPKQYSLAIRALETQHIVKIVGTVKEHRVNEQWELNSLESIQFSSAKPEQISLTEV